MEYADDIAIATTDKKVIEHLKENIPPRLQKSGLMSKTEEYTVKCKNEDEWKNAKIQGFKLNTEADIANRKSLSLNALTNLKDIFKTNVCLQKQRYEHLKHISHLYIFVQ